MAAIFSLLQRVLPKYALTAITYRLARIRHAGIKNFLIRRFIRLYDVDVSDVAADIPDAFEDFNAFFVRALRDGTRPIDKGESSIVSPVDGTVSQAGPINDNLLFQAKGFRYSLQDLLAADLQDAESYVDGRFATIYLAPYNYHRVHAPLGGRIRLLRYVPGDLYSVNRATVANVDGLFTSNERLICHVERHGGPFVLIFVGALNVYLFVRE